MPGSGVGFITMVVSATIDRLILCSVSSWATTNCLPTKRLAYQKYLAFHDVFQTWTNKSTECSSVHNCKHVMFDIVGAVRGKCETMDAFSFFLFRLSEHDTASIIHVAIVCLHCRSQKSVPSTSW